VKLGEYDERWAALREGGWWLDSARHEGPWNNLIWAYAKFGYATRSKDAVARANARQLTAAQASGRGGPRFPAFPLRDWPADREAQERPLDE
jgi:hypothetical protein